MELQDILDEWKKIILVIEKDNAKISNLLEEVILEAFSKNILTVSIDANQKFHKKSLEKDSNEIERILFECLGAKIKLKFIINEVNESSSGDIDSSIKGDKEHPLFMKFLDTFEGEIIR